MHIPASTTTHQAGGLALLATVVGVGLVLSGCGGGMDTSMRDTQGALAVTAQSSEPAAAASPTSSPSLTITGTPTSTPTVTPTADANSSYTSILPTPSLPAWVMGDFFFGSNSLDCKLPCWQNLIVGMSSTDEIQHLFNTEFGFNGNYSLSEEPIIREVMGCMARLTLGDSAIIPPNLS